MVDDAGSGWADADLVGVCCCAGGVGEGLAGLDGVVPAAVFADDGRCDVGGPVEGYAAGGDGCLAHRGWCWCWSGRWCRRPRKGRAVGERPKPGCANGGGIETPSAVEARADVVDVEVGGTDELAVLGSSEHRLGVSEPLRLSVRVCRVFGRAKFEQHEVFARVLKTKQPEAFDDLFEVIPRRIYAVTAVEPVVSVGGDDIDPGVARIPRVGRSAIVVGHLKAEVGGRPDTAECLHSLIVENGHERAPCGNEVRCVAVRDVGDRLGFVVEGEIDLVFEWLDGPRPFDHVVMQRVPGLGCSDVGPRDQAAVSGLWSDR